MVKTRTWLPIVLASVLILTSGASAKKLTFMQWSLGDVMDAWWEETLQEFGRIYDVEVERVYETTYGDKLLTMIASGQAPDVFLVRFGMFPTLATHEQLLDITEFIENDAELQQYMLPQDRARSTVNGRWYGLGFKYAFAHVWYDREVFNQAGIEPMPLRGEEAWSWDTFVDVLRKVSKTAADGTVERYGLSYTYTNWSRSASLLKTLGVEYFSEERGIDISSTTAVDAIMELRELRERGLLAPNTGVANSRNRLVSGQAAIILDLDSDPHGVLSGNDRGMDWYGLGAYPAGRGRDVGTSYMFGENIAIHWNTPEPELAYEFLKFAALRSWNVESDMPYLFQGRSGDALHPDEPALAYYALMNTTTVQPYWGLAEINNPAMQAVYRVIQGLEPASYLEEVQRVIDTTYEELRAEVGAGISVGQ